AAVVAVSPEVPLNVANARDEEAALALAGGDGHDGAAGIRERLVATGEQLRRVAGAVAVEDFERGCRRLRGFGAVSRAIDQGDAEGAVEPVDGPGIAADRLATAGPARRTGADVQFAHMVTVTVVPFWEL